MPVEYDVVVLGAGMAGSAAALAAAQSGARVCIIAGPPAASALFSGAWRGPCPDELRSALRDVGYELQACKTPLPHPAGALLLCDFSTRSHAEAQIEDGSVVCGIDGLAGFDAAALAKIWSARSGAALRAATISLAATPRAGWAPASLAAFIERDPAALAAPLRAMLAQQNAKAVILPAVLGINTCTDVHARIADAAGCRVGEALGVAPSLPGWRLHNALHRMLAAKNVAIIQGRAVVSAQGDRRIRSVHVGDAVVQARAFVLATGKFAAGGIEGDGVFRETALDCPVWVDHLGAAFEGPDPLILTDPVRSEDQPLLRAGVHVNDAQQPVNHENDVVFENVFVAGTVRSEWNVLTHGIGDAAQDGWHAGTRAVKS